MHNEWVTRHYEGVKKRCHPHRNLVMARSRRDRGHPGMPKHYRLCEPSKRTWQSRILTVLIGFLGRHGLLWARLPERSTGPFGACAAMTMDGMPHHSGSRVLSFARQGLRLGLSIRPEMTPTFRLLHFTHSICIRANLFHPKVSPPSLRQSSS